MQALEVLDPSFYFLINLISQNNVLLFENDYDYEYDYDYYNPTIQPTSNFYFISMVIDIINFTDPYQIENDITDAFYITLSWVSYGLHYNYYTS